MTQADSLGVSDKTAVRLEAVTKTFDDVTAVDGIDLAVAAGEFLVIVGPSGCGKSTTLRMIAGLEEVTTGEIYFDDRRMTTVNAGDRNVAMVFQDYALYPHMSARRNITFGIGGEFTEDELEQRVQTAAASLGITELLNRKPDELSGGEQQRVALGRAICRDPAVFLMDEPLSNLDAELRVEMRSELGRLHQEIGTTTIYVTHDQTEAMTLGDRVAVMNDGEIKQVAPPQQLYDFPTNTFVASFIGDPGMNLLPVALSGSQIDHPDFEGTIEGYDGGKRQVVFGIRPEDLSLVGDEQPSGGGTITAELQVTEALGDSSMLHCTLSTGESLVVQSPPRKELAEGTRLTLAYDPQRVHLYDPETGAVVYHAAEPK